MQRAASTACMHAVALDGADVIYALSTSMELQTVILTSA